MKKKVISILLTAVLATGMAACGSNSNTADNSANNTADNTQNTAETSTESTGSADSAEKPVLTVGMEGTYAPYTYHDENGTLTGFEVDKRWAMMSSLLKQSGIPSLLHLMLVILMQL